MTKNGSSENVDDRTKFFRESMKNHFLGRQRRAIADLFGPAARRRRQKLTSALPPTQLRRRMALDRRPLGSTSINAESFTPRLKQWNLSTIILYYILSVKGQ